MDKKNIIAPEALKALNDFKLEIAEDLGINSFNNMTKSEYPAFKNNLKNNKNSGNKVKEEKRINNHDILY